MLTGADLAFYFSLRPFDHHGMPIEMGELHARYYRAVLDMAGGNVSKAARLADVSRETITRNLVTQEERRPCR